MTKRKLKRIAKLVYFDPEVIEKLAKLKKASGIPASGRVNMIVMENIDRYFPKD